MTNVLFRPHEHDVKVQNMFHFLPYDNWVEWDCQDREIDQADLEGGNCWYLSRYCKTFTGQGWDIHFAYKDDHGIDESIQDFIPLVNHAQLVKIDKEHANQTTVSILELSASDARTFELILTSSDCQFTFQDHFGSEFKYVYVPGTPDLLKLFKNKRKKKKDYWVLVNVILVSGFDADKCAELCKNNAIAALNKNFSFRCSEGPYVVAVVVSQEIDASVTLFMTLALKKSQSYTRVNGNFSKTFSKCDDVAMMMEYATTSLMDSINEEALNKGFGDKKDGKIADLLSRLNKYLCRLCQNS